MSLEEKIPKFTNEKLCEIIVTSRYLGTWKNEAISCMKELSSRRAAGSDFDFEFFISEKSKSLPNFRTDTASIIRPDLIKGIV